MGVCNLHGFFAEAPIASSMTQRHHTNLNPNTASCCPDYVHESLLTVPRTIQGPYLPDLKISATLRTCMYVLTYRYTHCFLYTDVYVCIHLSIYIYTYTDRDAHLDLYMQRQREKERQRHTEREREKERKKDRDIQRERERC